MNTCIDSQADANMKWINSYKEFTSYKLSVHIQDVYKMFKSNLLTKRKSTKDGGNGKNLYALHKNCLVWNTHSWENPNCCYHSAHVFKTENIHKK